MAFERERPAFAEQAATVLLPEALPLFGGVEVADRDAATDVDETRPVAPSPQLVDQGERLRQRGDPLAGVIAVEMEVNALDTQPRGHNVGHVPIDHRQRLAHTEPEASGRAAGSSGGREPQGD